MSDTRETDIAIELIIIPPKRMRALQPGKVDTFAESMAKRGLIYAIHVRARNGKFDLVIGLHRLEAAKKLGWPTIRGVVHYDLSDDQAELLEIDENLMRAELSLSEQALHLARRKELYEQLYPETKQGGAPGKTGGGKTAKLAKLASFAKSTSKMTGKSRRSVERAVARAKAIPEIGELAGTSLDKGTELDALAKLPEDKQHDLIKRAKAGEQVSAREASPPVTFEPSILSSAIEPQSRQLGNGVDVAASAETMKARHAATDNAEAPIEEVVQPTSATTPDALAPVSAPEMPPEQPVEEEEPVESNGIEWPPPAAHGPLVRRDAVSDRTKIADLRRWRAWAEDRIVKLEKAANAARGQIDRLETKAKDKKRSTVELERDISDLPLDSVELEGPCSSVADAVAALAVLLQSGFQQGRECFHNLKEAKPPFGPRAFHQLVVGLAGIDKAWLKEVRSAGSNRGRAGDGSGGE